MPENILLLAAIYGFAAALLIVFFVSCVLCCATLCDSSSGEQVKNPGYGYPGGKHPGYAYPVATNPGFPSWTISTNSGGSQNSVFNASGWKGDMESNVVV